MQENYSRLGSIHKDIHHDQTTMINENALQASHGAESAPPFLRKAMNCTKGKIGADYGQVYYYGFSAIGEACCSPPPPRRANKAVTATL